MWTTLKAGVMLAAVMVVLTFALHLLNQPRDTAVAAGYFIVLALVTLAVGGAGYLMRRRRN